MNLVDLGQRIKRLREQRRLKQSDVANALQISAQAVSKWERGENAPDIAILLDLTKLLGVSVDALLGRAEKDNDTFMATVFCTGLNHFAKQSQQLSPRDVALWANGIFHMVTEAVLRHDGVPIKYVGDGFLGFFSGPNHAQRAVRAALQAKTLVPNPDLVVMLHTGEVYLGKIGHTEYASMDIIGNTVNTAFLTMGWVAQNLPGGVGLTEETSCLLDGEFKLSKPELADVKALRRKVKVFAPKP